ncbi:hypothetical protein ACVXG7_26215, partial [Enterobacter hormaechei]
MEGQNPITITLFGNDSSPRDTLSLARQMDRIEIWKYLYLIESLSTKQSAGGRYFWHNKSIRLSILFNKSPLG